MIKKILKGESGSGLKGILFIIGIFAIAFFAGEGVGLVKEKVYLLVMLLKMVKTGDWDLEKVELSLRERNHRRL